MTKVPQEDEVMSPGERQKLHFILMALSRRELVCIHLAVLDVLLKDVNNEVVYTTHHKIAAAIRIRDRLDAWLKGDLSPLPEATP